MVKILHDTHKIAGHYLSYLINADATGLNDDEEKEAYAYEKTLPPGAILDVVDEESEFARCRVSNQMANCYTVDIYADDRYGYSFYYHVPTLEED